MLVGKGSHVPWGLGQSCMRHVCICGLDTCISSPMGYKFKVMSGSSDSQGDDVVTRVFLTGMELAADGDK